MARHNREAGGVDQRGHAYTVSYQPDWLRLVKVTRQLETGRQSTKTLCRNSADRKEAEPGDRVRTHIRSDEQDLDVEVAITDPGRRVVRVRLTCVIPGPAGDRDEVEFTLDNELPPPTPER